MSASAVIEAPKSVAVSTLPAPVMPSQAKHKFTLEEYFALNAASEIRYEYDEGEIIPMAGTTAPHNRIAGNFYVAFDRAFEERNCEVYIGDIGFRVSAAKYRYPNVMAICGDPIFDNNNPPDLLNPNVVIEVLSLSTENIDKGKKIEEYLHVPSVTDYLLVDQDRISVVHWSKQGERSWSMNEYINLSDTFSIASIDVEMTLTEIYRKVKFDAASQ